MRRLHKTNVFNLCIFSSTVSTFNTFINATVANVLIKLINTNSVVQEDVNSGHYLTFSECGWFCKGYLELFRPGPSIILDATFVRSTRSFRSSSVVTLSGLLPDDDRQWGQPARRHVVLEWRPRGTEETQRSRLQLGPELPASTSQCPQALQVDIQPGQPRALRWEGWAFHWGQYSRCPQGIRRFRRTGNKLQKCACDLEHRRTRAGPGCPREIWHTWGPRARLRPLWGRGAYVWGTLRWGRCAGVLDGRMCPSGWNARATFGAATILEANWWLRAQVWTAEAHGTDGLARFTGSWFPYQHPYRRWPVSIVPVPELWRRCLR